MSILLEYSERQSSDDMGRRHTFGILERISVTQYRNRRDGTNPATVAWWSSNNKTPDEAEQFALAIIRAAHVARQWNEETDISMTEEETA